MQRCSVCGSEAIFRSRARSRWETLRKQLTGKRPYRCDGCGWRGWAADSGPIFRTDERESAAQALAPKPPDLADVAVARERKVPASLDLGGLDRPAPAAPSTATPSIDEPQ